jgi:hypothetical protein
VALEFEVDSSQPARFWERGFFPTAFPDARSRVMAVRENPLDLESFGVGTPAGLNH